jgi:phage baseplate assembly protein W
MPPSIFGQGLSFPPRVGADGRLAWSVGEENVRESIRILLLTEPGERLMRENFGGGLREFLFEPNTLTTRTLIAERIRRALEQSEPRITVNEVEVTTDPAEPRLIRVTITFRLIATDAVDRLGLELQQL